MIEIKIKCLNPGCDIHYIINETPEYSIPTKEIASLLDTATQNIIQVMNARELFYKQIQNSSEPDVSSQLEFKNE